MKTPILLGAAAAVAALTLAALAAPALAQPAATSGDTPGAGGTKVMKPVTGEEVYRQVCQACHMADAKGGTGAGTIPALASNPRLAASAYPIVTILNGKGGMPWMRDWLSSAQIAAVTGYVRTHFGNTYAEPVTAAEVDQLKAALAAAK